MIKSHSVLFTVAFGLMLVSACSTTTKSNPQSNEHPSMGKAVEQDTHPDDNTPAVETPMPDSAPAIYPEPAIERQNVTVLPDWNADFEHLQPRFGSATEQAFLIAKSQAIPLDTSHAGLIETDSTFGIPMSYYAKTYQKPVFNEYGVPVRPYADYKGRIPDLNLHVVREVMVGEFILGTLFLVDPIRNKFYLIDSWSDATMSTPVVSPSGKHLLMHVNGISDRNRSMLVVLEAYPEGGANGYRVVAQNESKEWNIEDATWIDESTFVLKTETRTLDEETRQWESKVEYRKAGI